MSEFDVFASRSMSTPTPSGEALYELIVQLPRLYHAIRALARESEAMAGWSEGLWGLLQSLKTDGPRTVPQIARSKGVARQRIQKLVDEANAMGFLRFRENPDHKRSRIVMLTAEGRSAFEGFDSGVRNAAESFSENMDIRDLDAALRVMFDLNENLRHADRS